MLLKPHLTIPLCALAANTAIATSLPPSSSAPPTTNEIRAYASSYDDPATAAGSSPSATNSQQHTAQEVISLLNLTTSSEKGYFYETFRDAALVPGTNRSVSTAIYYLLEGADEFSYWHRVDAAEVWHWYAGAPLSLYLALDDGTPVREHVLGNDLFGDQTGQVQQRPQAVVAKDEWQRARSWGDWSLVGTTGE